MSYLLQAIFPIGLSDYVDCISFSIFPLFFLSLGSMFVYDLADC